MKDIGFEILPADGCSTCAKLYTHRAEIQSEVVDLRDKIANMVRWLEANQPDVFQRGLWEAIR